jgi:hypothetical protein
MLELLQQYFDENLDLEDIYIEVEHLRGKKFKVTIDAMSKDVWVQCPDKFKITNVSINNSMTQELIVYYVFIG